MPYHQVKHPLNFIYLSCLLDRGLIILLGFDILYINDIHLCALYVNPFQYHLVDAQYLHDVCIR